MFASVIGPCPPGALRPGACNVACSLQVVATISFFGCLGLSCWSKDTEALCLVSLASALCPKSLPHSQKMLPSQTPSFLSSFLGP